MGLRTVAPSTYQNPNELDEHRRPRTQQPMGKQPQQSLLVVYTGLVEWLIVPSSGATSKGSPRPRRLPCIGNEENEPKFLDALKSAALLLLQWPNHEGLPIG